MSPDSTTLTKPESASLNWDLDSIFPGGATGSAFSSFRADLKSKTEQLGASLSSLPQTLSADTEESWEKFILAMQSLSENLEHGRSFSHCLVSDNVGDDLAQQANSELNDLWGRYLELMTGFEALARKQSDSAWEALMSRPDTKEISFSLNEMRDLAKLKLDPELEALAEELAVNGYHGWNFLYDKMSGDLRVDWTEDGKTESISLGQLATRFNSADRETRKLAFAKLTEAWESRSSLAAMALNYQAGFRLSMYKRRNWESALDEPLRQNRMKRESLEAMWAAVSEAVPRLKPYLEAKKKLLGIDKFRWYDETAPVGASSSKFTWDEAWGFVDRHVGAFSPDLKKYCQAARDNRWVEAEDRPGKAGGGFCTGLPLLKESRIFMTYGETYGDLSTLAHELGHAYHSDVLKDKPYLATIYPMNLAESASTFNELLVIDAALAESTDRNERLMLLDQKMQSALTFFCNIHCRFLFDQRFYEARAKGALTPSELSEMMVSAQKDAYGDLLADDGYHPLFWASKLHFFFTEAPFYNFPYTFGYLFATGIYAHAKCSGGSFAEGYRNLLADTGSMTAEEVAKKHLNADLTDMDFWRMAVSTALEGLDDFVKLANE